MWTDGSGGANGGHLRKEETGHSRLHGCLAISTGLFNKIGGWPETDRMDFDLQMLARLREESNPVDPCRFGVSQYFFRWASTHAPHGQAYCTGPEDNNWMKKCQEVINKQLGSVIPNTILRPAMDTETIKLYPTVS